MALRKTDSDSDLEVFQKARAGFQNWILWDTAALQGQRAIKAWRKYSRILDMCISNWNVEMKDVIQVPLNETSCCSTSIKSTMTNEADFLAVYGETQSAEVLVLFLCDGQTLGEDFAPLWLAVEEDHVDWISGQTRGLSGQ